MQKATLVQDSQDNLDRTGDPLAGSGFEQEQPEPNFTEHDDNGEAEAK